MSDLTKEYLDKQLDSQTKELKSYVEEKIVGLDTKIENEIAGLARITANGFEEIKRELDVRKEVASLDRRTFRIEQALNIKN